SICSNCLCISNFSTNSLAFFASTNYLTNTWRHVNRRNSRSEAWRHYDVFIHYTCCYWCSLIIRWTRWIGRRFRADWWLYLFFSHRRLSHRVFHRENIASIKIMENGAHSNCFGVLVINVCGITYLSFIAETPWLATATSALVFLPGDIIKAIVASIITIKLIQTYPLIETNKKVA